MDHEENEEIFCFQSFATEDNKAIAAYLSSFYDTPAVDSKIIALLDKYQEQPELLDPHLESIITPLMEWVRNPDTNLALLHRCCEVLYIISKVRGYKTVINYFPHDVVDFEFALQLLLAQDFSDTSIWFTRYILLLWLSLIVLIPFDLISIDSSLASSSEADAAIWEGGIIQTIIRTCKKFLSISGPSQQAAAFLLSRLLSRPDLQSGTYLIDFFKWTKEIFDTDPSNQFNLIIITGVMYTCAMLFRSGSRKSLPLLAEIITPGVQRIWEFCRSSLLRKLSIKLVQRIGLVFLKPRIPTWRYQRGNRAILLSSDTTPLTKSRETKELDEEAMAFRLQAQQDLDDDEIEVPEIIDDIVQQLLVGLRERDTIVRWSAAKGIGRITSRLPKDYADEIVVAVMDLLSDLETDSGWHGGCLALAELARRGLLLPQRLGDIIPVVTKALLYDVPRGAHSIGTHVRDAACYVCWAFARAYSPDVMGQFVYSIAGHLLVVSCLDRDINVRRAASAAFQESVGRQGNFPHGIEINTTADYFALGNRANSYLKIAPFVASFETYQKIMIDHLFKVKLFHWDADVRDLSASSLAAMTYSASDYMISTVLPSLVPLYHSRSLHERHGSLLAAARITLELSKNSVAISSELESKIVNFFPNPKKASVYSGKGSEFILHSTCVMIECIALSKLSLKSDYILLLMEMLDVIICNSSENVRVQGNIALKTFSAQYLTGKGAPESERIVKYLNDLESGDNVNACRGLSTALGMFPHSLLKPHLVPVIKSLAQAASFTKQKDAETRRNAIKSLGDIFCLFQDDSCLFDIDNEIVLLDKLMTVNSPCRFIACTILNDMDDYSTDKRGDVGSWVRIASMEAGKRLLYIFCSKSMNDIATEFANLFIPRVLKQLMEKIPRIREVAGKTFEDILKWPPAIIDCARIHDYQHLVDILPSETILNWVVPSFSFPLMIPLLSLTFYRPYLVQGLILSVGGITESLMKASSKALLEWFKTATPDEVVGFGRDMYNYIVQYGGLPRVVYPVFECMSLLFNQGCFDESADLDPSLVIDLFEHVRLECRRSTDIYKLSTAINVYLGFINFKVVKKRAIQACIGLLGHSFPKLRQKAAEQIYERLIVLELETLEMEDDTLDAICDILLNEDDNFHWIDDDAANAIIEACEKLADLFGVATPYLSISDIVKKTSQKDVMTYADFVKDFSR